MNVHPRDPGDASGPANTYPCLRPHATGACLSVSVVPNARRSEIAGLHDGALRVRLAAPPIEGRANDALLVWLADELDLPKRAFVLLSGASGRRKKVIVQAELEYVRAWLRNRLDVA
jgi:uncharacterized protein (TIGR00251 family)